ncbi:hypothetical protein BKA07_002683 [Brevibacterium marinum]|uniref:Uncharacterized protein n=1 Tax=Brevibacterium marinum TaxID=418643 RepID=A0A846S3R8_9MICO|nr:hypothetical protein [Brevibacterium marinum]
MNIEEVREIIRFAEGVDGTNFPEDAAETWLQIVRNISIAEAWCSSCSFSAFNFPFNSSSHYAKTRALGSEPSRLQSDQTR